MDAATPEAEGWTEDRVLENARRVLSDLGAIAYIGELSSGASALSLPVLNEGGVLMVSPSSTYVGLTREGGIGRGEPEKFYPSGERTFARVVPADHLQATAQVALMAEKDVERLYVLHDGGLYGRGLAAQVETVADRENIEVLSVERGSDDPADAEDIARDVAQAAPDGVLYAGDVGSNALGILDAVTEAIPDAPLFVPDRRGHHPVPGRRRRAPGAPAARHEPHARWPPAASGRQRVPRPLPRDLRQGP